MHSDVDKVPFPRPHFLPKLVRQISPPLVLPLGLICLQALLELLEEHFVLHSVRVLISSDSILLSKNLTIDKEKQDRPSFLFACPSSPLLMACTRRMFRCSCRLQDMHKCFHDLTKAKYLNMISCPSLRFLVPCVEDIRHFTTRIATTNACSYRAKEPPNKFLYLKYGQWHTTIARPSLHFNVCNTPTLIEFNAIHSLKGVLSLSFKYSFYTSYSNTLQYFSNALHVTFYLHALLCTQSVLLL